MKSRLRSNLDVRIDLVLTGAVDIPTELRDAVIDSHGSILTVTDVNEIGAIAQAQGRTVIRLVGDHPPAREIRDRSVHPLQSPSRLPIPLPTISRSGSTNRDPGSRASLLNACSLFRHLMLHAP